MGDSRAWANSILAIAYERQLALDQHTEFAQLLEAYLRDASAAGTTDDYAKTAIKNEIIDIAPVIEPFRHVLKRVLRNLKRAQMA